MTVSRRLLVLLLLTCSLVSVSCVWRTTPPAPDMAAGVYINTAYEYYTWDEGLSLLIWHDATESSMCDSSGSTRDPEHRLECSAVSEEGQDIAWQITTTDGIHAEFSIDGTSYDLNNGNVFLVDVRDSRTDIQQLQRDLTDLGDADMVEFSLDDDGIGPFIEARNSEL